MVMIVNTDKTKVVIIKSKNITHHNLFYDNNYLEHVYAYKYLGILTFLISSSRMIALRKLLLEAR